MLRMTVVLAALAMAVGQSGAEQLNVESARQFVLGKLFAFNCFEGTRGAGRIYSDGSVAGTIQFGGSGPARYVVLPPGTVRAQGEAVSVSGSVPALFQSRQDRPPKLPRLGLRPALRLLRFHPPQQSAVRAAHRRRPARPLGDPCRRDG